MLFASLSLNTLWFDDVAYVSGFPLYQIFQLQPISPDNAQDLQIHRSISYGTGRVEDVRLSSDNSVLLLEKFPSNILYPPPPTGLEAYAETLQIWDLELFTHRCNLVGHTEDINHSELSRDGRFAASASRDGTIRIWQTTDCLEIKRISREGDFWTGLGFSSDSRYLFYLDAYDEGQTHRGYVAILDISQNFIEVYRQEIDRVSIGTFSSDSRLLALATANGIVIIVDFLANSMKMVDLNITAGNVPVEIWFGPGDGNLYTQHFAGTSGLDLTSDTVIEPVFYPQGIRLFVNPYQNTQIGLRFARLNQIEVINLLTGQTLSILPSLDIIGPSRGVDWNDEILLTLQPDFLNLYDLSEGVLLKQLPQKGVRNGLFSEDNRILVAWPTERNEIVFWGVNVEG